MFKSAYPIKKFMRKKDSEPVYDPQQLKMGTKHEMEHTDDPKVAEKTAKDHLRKHPKYYTYLEAMEEQMTKDEEKSNG